MQIPLSVRLGVMAGLFLAGGTIGATAAIAAVAPVTVVAGTTVEKQQEGAGPLWKQDSLGFYGLGLPEGYRLGAQLDHYERYGLRESTVRASLDRGFDSTGGGFTLEASGGGQAYLPQWSMRSSVHLELSGARVLNAGAGITSYEGQKVYPLDLSVDQYTGSSMLSAGTSVYLSPGTPPSANGWGQWLHTFDNQSLLQLRVGWGSTQEALSTGKLLQSHAGFGFIRYHILVSPHWFFDVSLSHSGGVAARNAVSFLVGHVY
jgi:YaiO family outer membrane protein